MAVGPSRAQITVSIQFRIEGQRGILTLNGPLTRDTGGTLQARVDDLLRQGIRDVILEIGGVPYLDSNGLGQLVQAYKTITSSGARLQIVGVTGRMRELASLVTSAESSDAGTAATPGSAASRSERKRRTPAFWVVLLVALAILLVLIAKLALAR